MTPEPDAAQQATPSSRLVDRHAAFPTLTSGGQDRRLQSPGSSGRDAFARMQPPEDQLGVPFPLTPVLVREPGLVMALEGGTAYSTGMELDLRCRVERAGASEDRWADIVDGFMGGRRTAPGSRRAREALHWSVSIPGHEQVHAGDLHMFMQRSGERSQEEYRLWRPSRCARPDRARRLVGVGGSGSGGEDDWRFDTSLWLTPLPPASELTLGWEWPALELAAGTVTLPVDGLLAAAAAAVPL